MLLGKLSYHKKFSGRTKNVKVHFEVKRHGLKFRAINQSWYIHIGRSDLLFIFPSGRSRPKEVTEAPKICPL